MLSNDGFTIRQDVLPRLRDGTKRIQAEQPTTSAKYSAITFEKGPSKLVFNIWHDRRIPSIFVHIGSKYFEIRSLINYCLNQRPAFVVSDLCCYAMFIP